jgi:hypothetical protein
VTVSSIGRTDPPGKQQQVDSDRSGGDRTLERPSGSPGYWLDNAKLPKLSHRSTSSLHGAWLGLASFKTLIQSRQAAAAPLLLQVITYDVFLGALPLLQQPRGVQKQTVPS